MLLKEVNDISRNSARLVENVAFFKEMEGKGVQLCESAEELLGNIYAQMNAGKNPFKDKPNLLKVFRGLTVLRKGENMDAYADEMPAKKIALKAGKDTGVNAFLARVGSRAKSLFRDETLFDNPKFLEKMKREVQKMQSEYRRLSAGAHDEEKRDIDSQIEKEMGKFA